MTPAITAYWMPAVEQTPRPFVRAEILSDWSRSRPVYDVVTIATAAWGFATAYRVGLESTGPAFCFLFSWLATLGVTSCPLAVHHTARYAISCPSHFPRESGLVFPNQSRRQDGFLRVSLWTPARFAPAQPLLLLLLSQPHTPSVHARNKRQSKRPCRVFCHCRPPPLLFSTCKQTNQYIRRRKNTRLITFCFLT